MGSDPASVFSNLFLSHYESEWMKKEKKSKIGRGKRFSNVFRLIDDLNVLNDGGKVERSTNKIHPPETQNGDNRQ